MKIIKILRIEHKWNSWYEINGMNQKTLIILINRRLKLNLSKYFYKYHDISKVSLVLFKLEYPVGRQSWYMKNSPCIPDGQPYELTLSQCIPSTQFTCDDGTCISVQFRYVNVSFWFGFYILKLWYILSVYLGVITNGIALMVLMNLNAIL